MLTLVAACTGDEILGPPISGACVAGRVSSSEGSYEGRIDSSRCRVWSYWEYDFVSAEAWTLEAKAKTAYVIRVIPAGSATLTPPAVNLFAYGRNAAGDAALLTYGDRSFGVGDRNREMVLTVDSATTFSLRVELEADDDSTAYRLEVSSCPVLDLPLDSLVRGINSNSGCFARGTPGAARSRVTFLSVRNTALGPQTVWFRRTAGTASVRAQYAGYDADFAALLNMSFRTSTFVGIEHQFTRNHSRIGRTTLALGVHADSGATLEASASRSVNLRASTH